MAAGKNYMDSYAYVSADRLHVNPRRRLRADQQGRDDRQLAHHPEGRSRGRRVLLLPD